MNKPIQGYTRIPNEILNGNHDPVNIAVLAAILSYGKACWASASKIAERIGCCEKTVRKSFRYWKAYCDKRGWPIWKQERRPGGTYLIEVRFPGLIGFSASDDDSEGVGTEVRDLRTDVPTINTKRKITKKKGDYSLNGIGQKKLRYYIDGDPAYKNSRGEWMVIIYDGSHKVWNGPESAVEWR